MKTNLELLQKAVDANGQAAVARELGYSPSAVNQVLKGKYKGRLDSILRRVAEVYGQATVICPVMGEISLKRCAAERAKPFGASSPQRIRLYRACRACEAHKI